MDRYLAWLLELKKVDVALVNLSWLTASLILSFWLIEWLPWIAEKRRPQVRLLVWSSMLFIYFLTVGWAMLNPPA